MKCVADDRRIVEADRLLNVDLAELSGLSPFVFGLFDNDFRDGL